MSKASARNPRAPRAPDVNAKPATGRALVVGTGRMARLRTPRLQSAGLQVTITGRDAARTRQASADLSAQWVDYRRAARDTYDCVLVTSASEDHLADLHAFLPTAPVTLCEKPVTTDVAEAGLLVESTAAMGAELYVGFQRRFDPSFEALRDRVRAGELGTLLHIRATDFDHEPGSREFIAKSGGIFRDLIIHDLDCLTWLTGRAIKTVHAYGSALVSDNYRQLDDCDTATVSLVLDSGALATVNASRSNPLGQDVRMEILGTRTAVSVGLTQSTPLRALEGSSLVGSANPPQDFMVRFADAFRRETEHFARYVTGQSDAFPGCTLQQAVNASIAAEACDLSWRSGQPVSWAQIDGP